MKCPICGKGMLRGMVISSGSMPFSTNVIFKPDKNDGCSNLILEKEADLYLYGLWPDICDIQSEMIAAAFIRQD